MIDRDRQPNGVGAFPRQKAARPKPRLRTTDFFSGLLVPDESKVREPAVALRQVEAVAGEELVRHGEADVADRQVVHEPPVRAVEERADRDVCRPAEP